MSQLTEKEMILKLIECIQDMEAARVKYNQHPGGGASQVIKVKLRKRYAEKITEANNAAFNIKQLLK